MIERGKKPMDHLSFNVSVAYALTKLARKKRTCMPHAHVRNPGGIHYTMA